METRFGVKDFFLFSLLIVLLIVMGLGIQQYDRQYQIVRDIDQQGKDQLRDLDAIRSGAGAWSGCRGADIAAGGV